VTRYLSLTEFLWLAEEVAGISADVLSRSGRIDLAESALHAPMAGFGEQDFYPDVVDKAAVLCWMLARNHQLPDGNKRAAWTAMVVFIDMNRGRWDPDPPDIDDAERTMHAVAAGTISEEELAKWLRERTIFE